MTPQEMLLQVEILFEKESPELVLVEQGEWVNEYKDMCTRDSVYEYDYKNKAHFFRVSESTDGSHYGHEEKFEPEFVEVFPRQVQVTEYVTKDKL